MDLTGISEGRVTRVHVRQLLNMLATTSRAPKRVFFFSLECKKTNCLLLHSFTHHTPVNCGLASNLVSFFLSVACFGAVNVLDPLSSS